MVGKTWSEKHGRNNMVGITWSGKNMVGITWSGKNMVGITWSEKRICENSWPENFWTKILGM